MEKRVFHFGKTVGKLTLIDKGQVNITKINHGISKVSFLSDNKNRKYYESIITNIQKNINVKRSAILGYRNGHIK